MDRLICPPVRPSCRPLRPSLLTAPLPIPAPLLRQLLSQPMEIYVDDEAKLTLHGLVQHYIMLEEADKNRKLNDLLDALDFNQVPPPPCATGPWHADTGTGIPQDLYGASAVFRFSTVRGPYRALQAGTISSAVSSC